MRSKELLVSLNKELSGKSKSTNPFPPVRIAMGAESVPLLFVTERQGPFSPVANCTSPTIFKTLIAALVETESETMNRNMKRMTRFTLPLCKKPKAETQVMAQYCCSSANVRGVGANRGGLHRDAHRRGDGVSSLSRIFPFVPESGLPGFVRGLFWFLLWLEERLVPRF